MLCEQATNISLGELPLYSGSGGSWWCQKFLSLLSLGQRQAIGEMTWVHLRPRLRRAWIRHVQICLHNSGYSAILARRTSTLLIRVQYPDRRHVNSECSFAEGRFSNVRHPRQSLIVGSCYKKSKSKPFSHSRRSRKLKLRSAERREKPDSIN